MWAMKVLLSLIALADDSSEQAQLKRNTLKIKIHSKINAIFSQMNSVTAELDCEEERIGYSDDKLTVTNKFEIPQTENDVEALKIWAPENPAHVTKPGIKFELWRKGGEAGPIGQKVDGVEAKAPGSDNKVNFGKQEKTDINGVVYEYFVKEIFEILMIPLSAKIGRAHV